MAINFLNNVALNKNELRQARIENQPNNTAAGAGVLGQLFFDTTEDTLKQYVADDGSGNAGWAEVGTTSGVETFSNTNVGSTYVDFSVVNASAIGDVNIGFADLNAVDGTSTAADRFLTKNNKWATIPFGDITEVQGGTYISVTNQTGPVPIVNHDATSRTDTTSTVSANVFPVVDSVSTNSTGHVTAVNVKTVTVPDNNTTYDLLTAPTGTAIRLDPSTGANDDVTISGTTGQTALTRISASELRVALTDDVTIIDDLSVGGTITQTQANETNSFASPLDMNNNKITEVKTGTAATDAVNLGQVELLVAGVGVFQGSYNAATNSPALEGGSNVALDQGDYFVVSVSGSFLGEALEPGDFIFANNTIAANSSPALSNYTVVQADDNVAGAGATDGATQKGVSGFDSENFTVSTNGWVQLKPQSNPYAKKIALTGGVDSGGQTTFTVNIVTMFGTGALAANCIATVKETASNLIVYPEVTGNGTGSLDFKFIPVVSTSAGFYTAYVSYI
jgi:hypothetical protein